jgi:hypothetical protein
MIAEAEPRKEGRREAALTSHGTLQDSHNPLPVYSAPDKNDLEDLYNLSRCCRGANIFIVKKHNSKCTVQKVGNEFFFNNTIFM